MSIATQALSTVKAIGIVISIAIAVFLGFTFAVYLSLRSSEVTVPDVVGKDRFVAENELTGAGLNFRVRAVRPSNQLKADSIVFQLPRAGEVVKAGQTVAVDVSRPAKEGEASETISHDDNNANTKTGNENSNTNEAAPLGNSNENKPKRRPNANSNAGDNANTGNRNANTNRPKPKANANNGNGNTNDNSRRRTNSNDGETNANRPNRNVNRPTPPPHTTPQQ